MNVSGCPFAAAAVQAEALPGGGPGQDDPAFDTSGSALVIPAHLVVDLLTAEAVAIYDPRRDVRLQLSRPIYEIFRQFARPRWVDAVLPPEPSRRERALECVRQLERKGFLHPPATVASAATP
jgi:hypothetical protein